MIGRHFYIDDTWFVVARDAKESKLITTLPDENGISSEILSLESMPCTAQTNHIPDDYGKPAIYYNKLQQTTTSDDKLQATALALQKAYSTGDNEKERNKFKKYKL